MEFIRPKEVLRLIGVSKVTLWRMVRAGRFPPPVTLNVTSKAYVLEEVQAWMAAAAARRSARRARGVGSRPGDRRLDHHHRATGAAAADEPRAVSGGGAVQSRRGLLRPLR